MHVLIYSFSHPHVLFVNTDFLPIKCSACNKIFCSNHFSFKAHKCPHQDDGDHQVPMCPLCNKPVPMKAGESADNVVSAHIDQNCQSQGEKVFKNRCSFAMCKKRELMPLMCEACGLNHCLTHRHPSDHNCQPKTTNSNSSSASHRSNQMFNSFTRKTSNAFEAIRSNVTNTINNVNRSIPHQATGTAAHSGTRQVPQISHLQGNLTEEEALNIAIQESLASAAGGNPRPQTGDNPDQQKCRLQ